MSKSYEGNNKKNPEGYMDLTAYEAIRNTELEAAREDDFHKLLNTLFDICELSGFHIEGRIAIKDLKTGKVWR